MAAVDLVVFIILKISLMRFPGDILRQIEIYLMIATGLNIFLMGTIKLLENKDPKSLLILAWIAGPFLFAGLINWTVNGRTLLPTVPALAILFICFLNSPKYKIKHPPIILGAALLMSTAVSIVLLTADYKSANAARYSANYIAQHYGKYPGEVTFQGHWEFQYYMQNRGFSPVDINSFNFRKDDIMIVPSNQNIFPITLSLPEHFKISEVIEPDTFRLIGVHVSPAGFYSSTFGPAPFLFGPKFSEKYVLYRATQSFHVEGDDLLVWKSEIMKRYGF